METRLYEPEDLTHLTEWWKERWGKAPMHLPAGGVIVSEDGVDMSAGWLYCDNSTPICWVGWTVTNPSNSPTTSKLAMTVLLDALEELARSQGRQVMMMTTSTRSMENLLVDQGYKVGDENLKHLIKKI